MKNKTCLVIVFNHKFERNLPLLRKMYNKRFDLVYFLMPFYSGNDSDVIPVYECSYYFEGYFAQAYRQIYDESIDNYIFIGDDLILNPALNQDNICEIFNVDAQTSFIESANPLNKCTYWPYSRIEQVITAFKSTGVNYKSELLPADEAFALVGKKGFNDFSMSGFKFSGTGKLRRMKSTIKKLFYRYDLPYPVFAGYSDFVIISKEDISEFARLSGVFAAMGLWVEIAVPTTLRLISSNLKTNEDVDIDALCMWARTKQLIDAENKCNYDLHLLFKNWPDNCAYLHPVKLSKWKWEE
jgi:hypothetical protein